MPLTTSAFPDRIAAQIEDFISIEESGGNYDAYIGHADAPGGTITGKTIAQIYAFQRELIARGEPSSAVSKYQFVQRTLSALVQARNLDINTVKLDAPTQDMLAADLLAIRGYKLWLARTISDEEFAHRLSCEWASLPDPYNGGKSHYDGVGPNHAGQTLGAVYAALGAARDAA